MAKFRKKPVEIEAVQFIGAGSRPHFGLIEKDEPRWLTEALGKDRTEPGSIAFDAGWSPPILQIFTLEGIHRADVGDWIIRGIKGELYPCKPDIFAALYDKLEG